MSQETESTTQTTHQVTLMKATMKYVSEFAVAEAIAHSNYIAKQIICTCTLASISSLNSHWNKNNNGSHNIHTIGIKHQLSTSDKNQIIAST